MRKVKPHFRLALATLLTVPWLMPFAPAASAAPNGQLSQEDLEFIAQQDLDPDPNPYDLYFVRRDRNTTAVIDRPNVYDFQASAIRNADSTTDVWYCGNEIGGDPPAPLGHDTVHHARLSSSNTLVGSISVAVPPSGNHAVPDGYHACDVSVIKHRFPGVTWPSGTIDQPGEELYYMYYECGPKFMGRGWPTNSTPFGGPAEICLAASVDGVTWMKHNESLDSGLGFGSLSTVPTPVVTKHQGIIDNCEWTFNEAPHFGRFVGNQGVGGCDDPWVSYGAGHPSAISMPVQGESQREVWLYYYETRGTWASRGMVLRKSLNGIDFEEPIDVIATDENGDPYPTRLEGGKIRYYDVEVAGHKGVFIATPVFNLSYFAYSFDGVHFVVPYSNAPPANNLLRLAEVRADDQDGSPDLCVAPGAPAVVADKYGIVDRLTYLDVLSGEGKYGDDPLSHCYSNDENTIDRGATWGLYMLQGDFGQILQPSITNACAHMDGKNVREQPQRGENGSAGTIWWVKDGKYYSYANWSDFLAKNNNNPYAYFDISSDSFVRIGQECTSGGVRPTPVVAVADTAKVARGLKTRITVLANDTGAVDATSVTEVALPNHGNLSIAPSGVITYTHDGGEHTSDSFTYKVKDTSGLYSNTVTVTISIKPKSLLYRVNAGGGALTQIGGNWAADSSGSPSTYVNHPAMGNYVYSVAGPVSFDSTVPPDTNPDLFETLRFDLTSSPNMLWSFPILAGTGPEVEINLYFAEIFHTTTNQRKFNVQIEGVTELTNFDIVAAALGANTGTMRQFYASTDGTLNIELLPGAADAAQINGIEVYGPAP